MTSAGDDTAHNFNLDTQPAHAYRYARAREHVEMVKALWDSWEDDAFIRDKASGRFFDTGKVHDIDHQRRAFQGQGAAQRRRARRRAIRSWCRPASPRTAAGSPPRRPR